MKAKILILILSFAATWSYAQKKKIVFTGDDYFFQYDYVKAVAEYEKLQETDSLTDQQHLNLAESYFKTKNFEMAWDAYFDLYKKDTVVNGYHLNKMLRSLTENENIENVNDFIDRNKTFEETVWLDNAKANYKNYRSGEDNNLRFNLFNVSENSSAADFSPTFYEDKILFTSSRILEEEETVTNPGYLDIFVAKKGQNGDLQNVNRFAGISGGNFHKANPYYSKELNKLFYVLSNEEDGELLFDDNDKNALAVGVIDRHGGFLFLLKNLSTSFYYPFYDAASERLYFSANFKDSYGGTDIYYVETNRGQIMSAPINLGPQINTPGNEISPYVFEGGLYFSSDIFYGYGGMDVYKSSIHKNGDIGVPINLGKGLNSNADDFGFIIQNNKKNGLEGYFSSNRDGGVGDDDIYGFVVDDKPSLNTLILKGRVIRQYTSTGIADVELRIIGEDNSVVKELVTDRDGNYALEVPWQESVIIQAKKRKYSKFTATYTAKELQNVKSKKGTYDIFMEYADDLVEEREGQKVFRLNRLDFDKNSTEITSIIAEELDKVVDGVKKFPEFNLRIESHTDSKGSELTNFNLSQKRSEAIKDYLIERGVKDENILYVIGYGEKKLLNKCKNGVFCAEFMHQENRRSLITVLNFDEL